MKPVRILSWILAIGLAGALIGMVALPKLIGPSPNPIFALIAGRSGIALFEPFARIATGLAEVAAAVLLVLTQTRRFGAALAAAITLGAIGFHLSPWLGVQLPNMAQLAPLLRDGKTVAEIDSLQLPTDGGALFMMALVFLVTALAILWIELRGHSAQM